MDGMLACCSRRRCRFLEHPRLDQHFHQDNGTQKGFVLVVVCGFFRVQIRVFLLARVVVKDAVFQVSLHLGIGPIENAGPVQHSIGLGILVIDVAQEPRQPFLDAQRLGQFV